MRASDLAIRSAVLLGLAGVGLGIAMAASHDHALKAAHGHINLVGWVSLFLFSGYYRASPALDASRLALAQVAVWVIGTIILATGVTLIYSGYPEAEPAAAIGSLIVMASLIAFAWIVFRPDRSAGRASMDLAPGE